ncbi:MAG: flagellar export chaperone FliS [Actinomycetota bacterium]
MHRDAASHYARQRIETATPAQLIALLYGAGIAAIRGGIEAMARNDRDEINRHLLRAQDVVMELRCSLNPAAGEMAANLDAIYGYSFQRLVRANVERDTAAATEVLGILEGLNESWREACLNQQPAPAPA